MKQIGEKLVETAGNKFKKGASTALELLKDAKDKKQEKRSASPEESEDSEVGVSLKRVTAGDGAGFDIPDDGDYDDYDNG